MKRKGIITKNAIRMILLAYALIFLMMGCITLSTTEKLAMSPLYGVTNQEYEDIRGDFTTYTFLLYKDTGWGGSTVVTVERVNSARAGIYYMARVRYTGSAWRFMDTLLLRTASQLHTLVDEFPTRTVFRDRGGVVEEVVMVLFTDAILADLCATTRFAFNITARQWISRAKELWH